MAWGTRTDAEIAAPAGARFGVGHIAVGVVAGVIDDGGRREVAP